MPRPPFGRPFPKAKETTTSGWSVQIGQFWSSGSPSALATLRSSEEASQMSFLVRRPRLKSSSVWWRNRACSTEVLSLVSFEEDPRLVSPTSKQGSQNEAATGQHLLNWLSI